MDYEGHSQRTITDDLQAEIDALDARVTSLEGKMTTVQGQISTLQSQMTTVQGQITTLQGQVASLQAGVFAGRVLQYTTHHTPLMLAYFTNEITLPSNFGTGLYTFLTPNTLSLASYWSEGATFYYYVHGVLNGSSASLNFALSENTFTPMGGVVCGITAPVGTPNSFTCTCMLQVTNYTPTSADYRFNITATVGENITNTVSASGINFDPSSSSGLVWLGKIDTTPFTTVTRMQGYVMNVQ